MAFFIQQPERRNLILEGLLGGFDKGQNQASQLRMLERQQKQTKSALDPLVQGSPEVQDIMKDPVKMRSYIASLPIPDDLKKSYLDSIDKQFGAQQKSLNQAFSEAQKQQEKVAPILSGLENLQKMKQIAGKGTIGLGSGVTKYFSKGTQKDRAMYERLGKSMIQLATSIPIRNKAEFEALAEGIYDPSLQMGEIEGNLEAMETILKQSLQQYGYQLPEEKVKEETKQQKFGSLQEKEANQKNERPPLTSFYR